LAPTAQGNADALRRALDLLAGPLGAPGRLSRFWVTPAWPPGSGPEFVNAVAVFAPVLEPEGTLAALHRVEVRMGRERRVRWGPRVIDLDLLAQGAKVRPDAATLAAWMDLDPETQAIRAPDTLILPHPRLHQRAFVLVPLAEVAPLWRHPRLGLTAAQMAAALDPADRAAMTPL
jgi:2-amino-4-hydroxy-6-hydroxymethyldihydropteridine diphosphokinase